MHQISSVSRPVDSVIEFLQAEQARGKTHVFLDSAARDVLRELMRPAPVDPPLMMETAEKISTAPIHAARLPISAPQETSIQAQAASLGSLRETFVPAKGPKKAKLMIIGEAPGYEDEKQQIPFVGAAGAKLDDILKAMGLLRDDVYLTHWVKYRPATANQTTNNRRPNPAEFSIFEPLIRSEIDAVQPTCIIAFGPSVAEAMLGTPQTIPSIRAQWLSFQEVDVRFTYQPSYLLQSTTTHSMKRELWEDMLAVMEKLELPISDKQRAYFLPKP